MLKKTTLTKYLFYLTIFGIFFSINTAMALGIKDSFSLKNDSLTSFQEKAGFKGYAPPELYIGLVLTSLFSVLGVIAVGLLIYSGFVWMTARGNESKVTKAKENIISVIIGLAVILGSYALTVFILKIFT